VHFPGSTPNLPAKAGSCESSSQKFSHRMSGAHLQQRSEQFYQEGMELISGEGLLGLNVNAGLSLLRASAELGHSGAAFTYALHLEAGKICHRNEAEAARFYGLSASGGHALGQCAFGFSLQKGIVIEANVEEAVKYYKLAADQGNAIGQANYGFCLETSDPHHLSQTPCRRGHQDKGQPSRPRPDLMMGFCQADL
jgi:TPR repeat protein